jgi:hypothetical protein
MAVDGRDSFIASSKEGVEEGLMVVEEGLMTMMAVEEGMMAGLMMFGEEGLLDAGVVVEEGLMVVEEGLMTLMAVEEGMMAGLMFGEEGLLDAGVGLLVVELALALMAVLMAVDGRDSFIASSKEGVEEGLMVIEEGLMTLMAVEEGMMAGLMMFGEEGLLDAGVVVEEGLMVIEEGLMTLMAVEEGMMAGLMMFGEEGLLDAGVGFLVVEVALMAALMAVDGRDSFKASSSTTDILSESEQSMSLSLFKKSIIMSNVPSSVAPSFLNKRV